MVTFLEKKSLLGDLQWINSSYCLLSTATSTKFSLYILTEKIDTEQVGFFPFRGQANTQNPGTCRKPTFLIQSLSSLSSPEGLLPARGQQPLLPKRLWLPLTSSQWMIAQFPQTTASSSASSPHGLKEPWRWHEDLSTRWFPTFKPLAITVNKGHSELLPVLFCISSEHQRFWAYTYQATSAKSTEVHAAASLF